MVGGHGCKAERLETAPLAIGTGNRGGRAAARREALPAQASFQTALLGMRWAVLWETEAFPAVFLHKLVVHPAFEIILCQKAAIGGILALH